MGEQTWRFSVEAHEDGLGSGGGTMLGRELHAVALVGEVEIGIAPGVQVARAPKRLTVLPRPALLAGMMHQQDGQVVVPLYGSEA